MATQQHEILAWLGDDHGLTADQIGTLTRAADEIGERYPDPDNANEREAALTVAYRLMVEDPRGVLAELAHDRQRAALAEQLAMVGLRQAAVTLIPSEIMSESGFARSAYLNRMSVRGWLGKR